MKFEVVLEHVFDDRLLIMSDKARPHWKEIVSQKRQLREDAIAEFLAAYAASAEVSFRPLWQILWVDRS